MHAILLSSFAGRMTWLPSLVGMALVVAGLCVAVVPAQAQNATWTGGNAGDPSEWVEQNNWTLTTIPSGTATFTNTGTTTVANDAGIVTIGTVQFTSNAQAYSFSIDNPFLVNGSGFVNNSTNTQTFTVTSVNNIAFQNGSSASAGTGAISINNQFFVTFANTATAGSATITNSEVLQFSDSASAGTAQITNNIEFDFFDTSTAAGAQITNAAMGILTFNNSSTAANAAIDNSGTLSFNNSSSAGAAVITTESGATTSFINTATGGSAQLIALAGGTVDFSGSSGPAGNHQLSAGSISGAGIFDLGANQLTVGSNNLSTTVSGTIADGGAGGGTGGSLVKVGTGTLTLSGTDTYTGGTTVLAGTLLLSGTGTLGAVSGATTVGGGILDLGGMAQTQNGGVTLTSGTIQDGTLSSTGVFALQSGTVNATLAGAGSVLKTTAGTVVLSLANSYTGGTTLAAGILQVRNNGSLGTGALTFNGGTLQSGPDSFTIGNAVLINSGGGVIDAAGQGFTLSGNISNGAASPGSLTFTSSGAPGTVTLSGNNTYSAPTMITNGVTVAPGSATGLSPNSDFTVNGALTLNGFSSTIRSLSGTGSVSNLLNGPATLTVAQPSGTATFGGVLSDSAGNALSLTKTGAGTEVLTGINTYTGATTINGGTLEVDGAITNSSSVTVNAGGTLAGDGVVDPITVTIASGATLAPGNGTPGTSITIAGNLAFQSGAMYLVQVNPSTASFANVTGTATLGGASVNAVFANGSYVAKQYTILTATGGVSGTFAPAVATTNLPFNFKTNLSYDANHAFLDLSLIFVPPPGSGLNGNQQAVGNAITGFFNSNGSIPLIYGGLTAAGLTQASGELATGSQQTTFDAMNLFMGLLTDPFMARNAGPGPAPGAPGFAGEGVGASAYAANNPSAAFAMFTKAPPRPTFEQRWSIWAAGYGGSQSTNGNAITGSNDATSRIYGTAVGADYLFSPNTVAGFALAGGSTNFSVSGLGSGRSDLFQAGAYVRHTDGPAYVSTALAYGWQDITTDRTVTVAGIDHLRAEFNANAYSGRIEGGYRFVAPWTGGVGITPYAAGQFTAFDLPAYAEQAISGAPTFALAYASRNVTDSRSELGLRTDRSFAMESAVLTLRGRFAWAHDYDPDRSIAATFQALPGASFVVNGAAQAADSALTTASLEMKWLSGWSASATFEGEFSDVTRSYAGKGVVRYQW